MGQFRPLIAGEIFEKLAVPFRIQFEKGRISVNRFAYIVSIFAADFLCGASGRGNYRG